ncbi:MAG TPA: ribosomal protein S18-alanine N-acetyltransferase [Pyrinomonadaceae bacterium]|jgi:ribosomal-protein-alanine N-acetyltransferase|nr:ribosomal protein S18-alanine N-acetyltransferase [Pyrinomonadaceae bacterium]
MPDLHSNDLTRICSVECSHIADLIRIGEETNLSPWSAQSYFEEIKNPRSIMLRLVSDENHTLGFVVGRLVAGGDIDVSVDAEIYNIAITTAHQRYGYGQLMLDRFLRECNDKAVENVYLEVRESNAKAISFYRKNGFEQVQTRPNFYNDPREHALLMRLKLKDQRP